MKDEILITGSSGFIGRSVNTYLMKNLDQNKYQIYTTSRKKNDKSNCLFLDLEDPSSILNIKKFSNLKYVIHLGASIGWYDDSHLFTTNILSTGCLSYLCKKWDAKLIFASAAIIHGTKSEFIDEDSKIILDSKYGQSKYDAENLIHASGIQNCILRISGVYGIDGPDHLHINKAITKACYQKKIPINNLSNEIKRNYIYVQDLAKFIHQILLENISGTHLVSSEEFLTINEMLTMISDQFTEGQKVIKRNKIEGRDQIVIPSQKIKSPTSFKEALAEMHKQQKR